jgi:hypothetical protein
MATLRLQAFVRQPVTLEISAQPILLAPRIRVAEAFVLSTAVLAVMAMSAQHATVQLRTINA